MSPFRALYLVVLASVGCAEVALASECRVLPDSSFVASGDIRDIRTDGAAALVGGDVYVRTAGGWVLDTPGPPDVLA